jgi:TonB-linked outer membrane protein, SusC/RagA family
LAESFVAQLKNGGDYKTQSDINSHQLAFLFTPLKGWQINAELNYRISTYFEHIDYQTVYGYDASNNPFEIANGTTAVREYTSKNNYFNPNIYTSYEISLKDHNFKVMAGFQSEELNNRTINASQNGIISQIPTLNTTSVDPKVSGAYNSWSTAGFFGRLNYDFDGRYLFEANVRYDGSSRFTRDKRWNVFPSFSAGWNIAQESFWENLRDDINLLKIRASWGQLGNQNTDNWYPSYSTMGFNVQRGNWIINGKQPNISWEPALVSSLLTWEKSRTWEVGLEWAALDNRFSGSFGYFQRKTYDMVGPAPELPVILGASVPKVNNLDMTSKGWDLSMSWRDYVGDFRYGVTLALSDNTVTIDKYPNPSKHLGSYYVGAKLGDIWGFETVGIAKTDEEMQKHLEKVDQSQLGSNWAAGDIMYADLDGDGVISVKERTLDSHGDIKIIGNTTPRYNFGLNFDFGYKGFDLKLFFQGTLKRDYMPNGAVFWGATGQGKWQALGFEEHLDYFRNDENNPLGLNLDSYYPRNAWNGGKNTNTQTRYIQNAAYCRLKNITLGYTLPSSLTKKASIQNVRIFVSGENLLTFTNFSKLADPELIDAGGWGFGKTYPLSKTISCGLSITF